jgi:hypothetical protein
VLAFQSGVSVAMTAAEASGAKLVPTMSVVLRYSSSVIVGFGPCALEELERRQKESAGTSKREVERISALYLSDGRG